MPLDSTKTHSKIDYEFYPVHTLKDGSIESGDETLAVKLLVILYNDARRRFRSQLKERSIDAKKSLFPMQKHALSPCPRFPRYFQT